MDFAAYRQEVAWTTYGVKNITVLDEPIYSPGTERYLYPESLGRDHVLAIREIQVTHHHLLVGAALIARDDDL